MKPPQDALLVVRCGKCRGVAGWIHRVDGRPLLVRPWDFEMIGGGAVSPEPVPVDRLAEDATPVLFICGRKHQGSVPAAELAAPSRGARAVDVLTRGAGENHRRTGKVRPSTP